MQLTCISIRQPWAWLIMAGHKTCENRSWDTRYRGTLAIHASGSFDFSFLDFLDVPPDIEPLNAYANEICARFGIGDRRRVTRHREELGAILGTVTLADVLPAPEEDIDRDPIGNPWCMYTGFAWMVKDPRPFSSPITGVKGKLNLWKYETENEERLI